MRTVPCLCCKGRNAIPTSRRGFCARCEEIITVIDYLVTQEKEEAERVAERKASGLVTPDEVRKGTAR